MQLVANHSQKEFVPKYFYQVFFVHIVTFAVAPWFFTWKAFLFAFGTAMLFGYSLGIFHHMLLTHRSFKCSPWLEKLGSLLATLTFRGPMAAPVRYVAMHRIHHAHADQELDPHSPHHGIWHSLITWFWNMPHGFVRYDDYTTYAEDVGAIKWHRWLDHNVLTVQLMWGALCFAGGTFWPLLAGAPMDLTNGFRYFIFGVFVRTFLSDYLMNAVDVINHTVGYRSYTTKDTSTNSFLMFVVHLGGAVSWHNNHHAHQHYFTVRRNWWEVDIHYQFLRFLSLFGMVDDILVMDESHKEPLRMPNVWRNRHAGAR